MQRAQVLASMLVALAACDAAPQPETVEAVCIFGWLTQKGAPPGTFWAITEEGGTVWELVDATSTDLERLAAAANTQIAVTGVVTYGGIFPTLGVRSIGESCPIVSPRE